MSKKINCRDVALRLQSYLDQELDDDRMVLIEKHLADCVQCGLEEDVYRAVKRDLKSLRSPTDSDAMERLRQFSTRISEVSSTDA